MSLKLLEVNKKSNLLDPYNLCMKHKNLQTENKCKLYSNLTSIP